MKYKIEFHPTNPNDLDKAICTLKLCIDYPMYESLRLDSEISMVCNDLTDAELARKFARIPESTIRAMLSSHREEDGE